MFYNKKQVLAYYIHFGDTQKFEVIQKIKNFVSYLKKESEL